MTGANYPRENGYLKVRLRKAFKMAGFINPLPRKGTETIYLLEPLIEGCSSLIHFPARGRKLGYLGERYHLEVDVH